MINLNNSLNFINPLKLIYSFVEASTFSWIGALIGAVSSNQQAQAQKGAANEASEILEKKALQSREDLTPYRQFGQKQMKDMQAWLQTPEGQFQAPTMEEVQAGQGYASRLGAIENSAAARGSLFSGNALRNIGEFGSAEYGKAYNQKQTEYQNELAKRMGFANLGYGAAGGSAGIAQNLGQRLANIQTGSGAAQSRAIGETGSAVGGAYGQYQGEKNWNDYLNRTSGNKSSGGWDQNDYGVGDDESDLGW